MSELIIGILVLVIIIVSLIAMYLFGFFDTPKKEKKVKKDKKVDTSTVSESPTVAPTVAPTLAPSDYRPFSELSEAIEPSMLPMAKKDYNELILKFFEVLNKRSKKIDFNLMSNPTDSGLNAEIMIQMMPHVMELQNKYTPPVFAKLIKYFACKHLTILLDNYYTGPPINIVVPAPPPMFGITSFPFTYKSKVKSKVVNASTLAPFKYISYNIPPQLKRAITELYDSLVDKYMAAINEIVAPLPEVNMMTMMTINPELIMQKYQPMIINDLMYIQQLFGSNVAILIQSLFTNNVLPLLDAYYKGPEIDISTPPNPFINQIINIKYPNTDKDKVFTVSDSSVSPTTSSVATTSSIPTTSSPSSSSSSSK